MKILTDRELDNVQKALSVVYREREPAESNGLWRTRVMGHIRDLSADRYEGGYLVSLQRLVWRLTPVAIAMVLLLSMALYQADFTSDYELAGMLVEDPLDMSLLGDYAIKG